jgi:hypothetical protein
MRPSAERLVDVASDLSAGRPRRSKFRSRKATYNPNLPFALRTSTDAGEVDAPRPLPSVEPVARFALSRSLQQAASAASTNPLFTKSPARAVGSIDALVAQTSSDPSPVCTVASILEQDEIQDVRVLVGPADRTGALRLTGPLADDRVKVCDGDAGGSVGSQRNRLLVHSDAEFVLVLEPTDTLLPRALLRLVQLLQTTDSAAVCFPMTAESDGEIGNALPFEPRRLVTRDYLGAPALWRRDVLIALGGWCHEPALDSLENYDLWLRLAAAHGQALLLPQVLVRRRFHPQKPIRLADLDPAGAQQVLRSRSAAFTMDTGTPASSPEELL